MKLFFRFSLVYLIFVVSLAAMLQGDVVELVITAFIATSAYILKVAKSAVVVVPLFLLLAVVLGRRRVSGSPGAIGYALAATAIMQAAFSIVKLGIPTMVPFYADAWLAEVDRFMAGGRDPWEIAHQMAGFLPVQAMLPTYSTVWTVPAFGLPVILAATDRDAGRTARFILLYIFCWFVIGNVLAIAGSSAGPVFYDVLLGGDRFAGLHSALVQSGMSENGFGMMQRQLWGVYADGSMALGFGISAFPSVHVAIATVTALYLVERSRWLALPGLVFLATIQFLSVYSGYHYAVDGYISIILVAAAWLALRRVEVIVLILPLSRSSITTAPVIAGR